LDEVVDVEALRIRQRDGVKKDEGVFVEGGVLATSRSVGCASALDDKVRRPVGDEGNDVQNKGVDVALFKGNGAKLALLCARRRPSLVVVTISVVNVNVNVIVDV